MGEFELITRHFARPARLAVVGVGDDCAVWSPTAGMQLAISSDMLVQGRHFLSTANPAHLGHKALAVNLSDLAACGAQPSAFTLSLALPHVDNAWLTAFSQGLFALADVHGCELIGGDTTQGPLNIAITVLGEVPPGAALLRRTACLGDDIYISGTLGQARMALEVFRGTLRLEAALFDAVRMRMEQPAPRVALGLALRGVAHATIDVSDGLLGDLGHILQASGVGACVETAWLLSTAEGGQPGAALSPAVASLAWDLRLTCALSGGDDYELLFTAPPARRAAVLAAANHSQTPVTRIGHITASGLQVLDPDGQTITRQFASFDHFA